MALIYLRVRAVHPHLNDELDKIKYNILGSTSALSYVELSMRCTRLLQRLELCPLNSRSILLSRDADQVSPRSSTLVDLHMRLRFKCSPLEQPSRIMQSRSIVR